MAEYRADPELLFLELTVAHPGLPLWELLRGNPEYHLELEFQSHDFDRPQYAFLMVSNGDVDGVEALVEADSSVGDAFHLGTVANSHLCRVKLTNDVSLLPAETAAAGIRLLSVESDSNDGWRLKMHVPSRDSLELLRRHYHDLGVTFQIKRLHRVRRTTESHEMHLSPAQYEALVVAFENGYFDVPRGINQGELAEKLDVSRSAVSQRIRRAVGKLVQTTLIR